MQAYIIKDQDGKTYMSLKTFKKSPVTGQWQGAGFIEIDSTDLNCLEIENISFEDNEPRIVEIEIKKNNTASEETTIIKERKSFWSKIFG